MAGIDVNLNMKGDMAKGLGLDKKPGSGPSALPSVGSMGSMLKPLGKILGVFAILGSLLTSFKGVIKIIGAIGKLLSLFLRPIAYALYVFLKPLYMFLKPFARIFNKAASTYMRKANKAVSIGMSAQAAGDTDTANQAYSLAMGFALKPLINVVFSMAREMFNGIIEIITVPFEAFYATIGALGDFLGIDALTNMANKGAKSIADMRNSIQEATDKGFNMFIRSSDDFLERGLMKLSNEVEFAKFKAEQTTEAYKESNNQIDKTTSSLEKFTEAILAVREAAEVGNLSNMKFNYQRSSIFDQPMWKKSNIDKEVSNAFGGGGIGGR